MLPSKLAFVDIETTGCSLRADRIIEIGVLRVENNKLVEKFSTLVNPEMYLPSQISSLTGISSQQLEHAPNFSSIRKELLRILRDCVFVAHNVRFDYGFIKSEFRREDISFKEKNLCTVKLSRNLFPEFSHHSLDHIIERFEIKCEARHRAFGDAEVLWKFYQILQKKFTLSKFEQALKIVQKRPSLPIGITEKDLDELPESPGVYVFYGADGMPLYVGKSINIHDRVLSHFSGDIENSKEMKISQQVRSIETIVTAGELGALFKEAKMVKELQPLYNRQLRRARKITVVKIRQPSIDGNKYYGVTVEETDEIKPEELENILGVFNSRRQAKDFLLGVCQENSLCEKLLGLENGRGECFGVRLGKCKGACVGKEKTVLYNARFLIAFSKNKFHPWPFEGAIEIVEKNEENEIYERHLVNQWCYLGTRKDFGNRLINDNDDFSELSREIKFDLDTYKILNRYFSRSKSLNFYSVL